MAGLVLIACSLAWMIIWSALGMKVGKEHPEWVEKVKNFSQQGDLGQFWSTYDGYKILITAHAHANGMACVAFLIGLAMKLEIIGYSATFQFILAIWLFLGVILSAIGDSRRTIPVIATGGLLFLTALIACFIGLFV